MDQVRVTYIPNPFEPARSRVSHVLPWEAGKTVERYLAGIVTGTGPAEHRLVVLNGAEVVRDLASVPAPGAVLCAFYTPADPVSGAIVAAANFVGSVAASASFLGATGAFICKVGLMAVVGLGIGAVISALTPRPKYDQPAIDDFDTSATYGWEPGANQTQEGAALPVLYGTRRVTAPVIAQHVKADELGNDHLYALLALCESGAGGADVVALADYSLDATKKAVFLNGNHYANYLQPDLESGQSTADRCTGGTASASSSLSGYSPALAFDDSASTGWASSSQTGWLMYDFGAGMRVNATQYTVLGYLYSGVFTCPSAWTFEGSNDNASWTVLDTRSGQSTSLKRTYAVTGNSTYYRFYRLNITGVYPAVGYLGVAELEIMGGSLAFPAISPTFQNGTTGAVPSGFSTTHCNLPVGKELDTAWFTYPTTAAAGATILSVLFSFPSGLYQIDYLGNVIDESVLVAAEYRTVAQDGTLGTWTAFTGSPWTISANTQSPYRVYKEKTGLSAYRFDVRARFSAAPTLGAGHVNRCVWEYLQEGVADGFTYPYAALLAIEALATRALSGAFPRIEAIATRSYVLVGGVAKAATNPAWICYDILTNTRYGGAVATSRIIDAEFSAWADYCDDEGIACHIYLDSGISLGDALNYVSALGRGSIVQRGTSFGVVVDKADTPVQLFSTGNIVAGSFREEFLARADLINAVEVTYFDSSRDYQRATVLVTDASYDTSAFVPNVSQVVLHGCVDRTLAAAHGRYLLNCNKYLRRTITFEADVDAIACQVGDLVNFSHDVPSWGYGGRVVSATAGGVTLDRSVTRVPGQTYRALIRHGDDTIEDVAIAAVLVSTTGATVPLDTGESWSATPAKYDVFAFGTTTAVVKTFRVIRITKTKDQRRRITALEYNASVYA